MPTAPTEERKLAAIMFTDMVGYSALAQRDDKVALELLEEHRRLLREIFPRFHGTEIKTIGDAFLVEFSSALEAAQCAIEIQRTLAKRNHDVTSDRRIELKIGIHIGDVVHREGDVYGDGVNIASRIEALAGAGGICVSMDVERQIRNALEARFEKFGTADLKNIKLPMDLFRIVLPWEKGAEPSAVPASKKKSPVLVPAAVLAILALLAGWWWMQRSTKSQQSAVVHAVPAAPANAPDQKSVAVLPFVNLSDDKGSEYFSDGVSEELLTVLQKIPGMHVAARTSAFSFKGKNATAQEIGQKLGAHQLYLQGRFYENRHSDKSTREALAAYQHAVELDPRFARAWAGVARTHTWIAGFATEGGQKAFDAHLASARDAVARALAIEPDLPDALYARAWIETNFDFNWSAATQTVSKAMASAPADPNVLIAAANLETALGNTDRAIEIYGKAVELDPVNAQSRSFLAFGLANTKRFADARAEYARVIELNSSAPWAHAGLGLGYLLENK